MPRRGIAYSRDPAATFQAAQCVAQQRNLLAQPERKLLSLNTDLGGVQARRILERLVAEEQRAASEPA